MKINEWVHDWILAIFADAERASAVRVELFSSGIATDRLDVMSWKDGGRAAIVPADNVEDGFRKHLSMLFNNRPDASQSVEAIIAALKSGKACVTVHPRGAVEIRECRAILDGSLPLDQYLNLMSVESQGGLLGEHAAGG